MRIAFVVQRYGLDVNGGAELHCRLIAERLVKYCFVDVITTCAIDYITWKNEYKSGEEILNGVRVIRFFVDFERNIRNFNYKTDRVLTGNLHDNEVEWMIMQGPYSSSLIQFLATHKDEYDSIIFFTYLYCTTYFGIQEVKDRAILVPTSHDEPTVYLSIFKNTFSSPQYILFNTQEERSFIHSLFKNTYIPSNIVGVAVDEPNMVDPENFTRLYGINNFILYAGRIDPSKGCQELFDYFIRYKADNPSDLKLILIGKPVMVIPNHPDIVSLGFLDTEEKFNVMAAARLLVMPSQFESLSMVILESWYCERPVLVNGRCSVLYGQCKRSNGGLWYENYDEFNMCLSFLLRREILCSQMGKSGYNFVKNNYDWEVIEAKYLDAIKYVIEKRRCFSA